MRSLHWFAGIAGTVAAISVMAPTASAQSSADQNYLNDLYSFLYEQDTLAYNAATQHLGNAVNIQIALDMCQAYRQGVQPADAFSFVTTYAMSEAANRGANLDGQGSYSLGLYVGTVMNLGSAYYCPEYQPNVVQALQSM